MPAELRGAIMKLALMAGLLLMLLGAPRQRNACDHAAPPPDMRWACAADEPCECQLVPAGKHDLDEDGISESSGPAAQSIACRISYFVVPDYPAAARKAQKQGSVSAMLVLGAEGTVQEARIQSGDPELAQAARAAFQQWRFNHGGHPENVPVGVKFVLSDSPAGSVTGTSLLDMTITAHPTR